MAKAIRYCHKAISNKDQSRDAYWFHTHTRLSLILARSNRSEEAIQIHKEWLAQEPDNYLACASVAFAYHFAGDDLTAYEYIKMAEKMPQGEIEICTGAGDICRNLKKYEEAHVYWTRPLQRIQAVSHACFQKQEHMRKRANGQRQSKHIKPFMIG
jgi:tetratricopeptide (TPR) repeat protein